LFVCLCVCFVCLLWPVCFIVGMLHPRHCRGNVTSTESSWECDIHGIIMGM
jgi:hypothetical protein